MRRSVELIAVMLSVTTVSLSARDAFDSETREYQATVAARPAYCLATHNIGRMALGVSNNGTLGRDYSNSGINDCFTGELVPSFEYPKGSKTRYLYGAALWIGAVVGDDTLVSIGQDGWAVSDAEFHPDEAPKGKMIYRSTINPAHPAYEGAVSEQDYIAVYTDTFTCGVGGINHDEVDGRLHRPIHVEVTQRSFAWSYSYTEDFVLFDYSFKNIGDAPLSEVFIGLFVDADIHHLATQSGARDDISGFLSSVPAFYLPPQCPDSEIINVAWTADNDGDLRREPGVEVPHITGVRFLRLPEGADFSYNWWISDGNPAYDFGPQRVENYRDFGTGGLGTPVGDRNKYHVLGNGEIDYDQLFTGAMIGDTNWVPFPTIIIDMFYGTDTRYLLSCGPIEIDPGEEVPLTYAFLAGEDFHTDPDNDNLPYNPELFYENVDFSDLGRNAIWADWIYDNPGVDTDSDGYAGLFDTCLLGGDSIWWSIDTAFDTTDGMVDTIIDTIWTFEMPILVPRSGDGVPDFRAASPPGAPAFRVEPQIKSLRIRWNGLVSETSVDIFSHDEDFEGYSVYLARELTPTSFAKIATYDIENYYKYVWTDTVTGWELCGNPFIRPELRCLYAPGGCEDTGWHPDDHSRSNPLRVGDSIFYFDHVGANASILGLETPFVKLFPGVIKPLSSWIEDTTTIPDSLRDWVLTDDGYFKYYEYEYTITNLIPDVSYWISVTAFDYGSPIFDANPQESPIYLCAREGVPLDGSLPCCVDLTGNVDGDQLDVVGIGDLIVLIDYLFISLTPLDCIEEANVDGDVEGVVDLGDLIALIDYLFISFTPPAACL